MADDNIKANEAESDEDTNENPSQSDDLTGDNSDTRVQNEIYTDGPIFSTQDVAKMLDVSDYNLVRYHARKFKEFLPDAINIEKGRSRFSSRDVDILRRIFSLKNEGFSTDRIAKALSDESNAILSTPMILTHENFLHLLNTDGFKDFMLYYSDSIYKRVKQEQQDSMDELKNILKQFLSEVPVPSPTAVAHLEEQAKLIEDVQSELIDKSKQVETLEKQLEANKEIYSEKIKELEHQLETEKNKSFFAKLFGK